MQSTIKPLDFNYRKQIMKEIHNHQRCAAAQEFQESLTQLEDILQVNAGDDQITTEVDTSITTDETPSENTVDIDLAALEDAVADIEQYLEQKQKKL
jgi:UDP-N-acetyl-D-mannosaminuronate dehydrogenase